MDAASGEYMAVWLQRLLGLINRKWPARPTGGSHRAVKNTAATTAVPDFSEQLALTRLERHWESEVTHLRHEIQQLRAEIAQWALEVRQLKMVSNTSSAYAEAVTLAQQGISTEHIADRCGISVREAELVTALAQSMAKGGTNP